MADDGLITAYLRELRFSVARLPDADDIVAEAEDHLRTTVERLTSVGRPFAEAEAEAIGRFGSAAVVARVCVTQSRQGAAVPTTRTRQAGLAAILAPLLLGFGQLGNVTIDRGAGHGLAVAMLVFAFPAFAFGLWGLRARHGGLGRLGRAALMLVFISPVLSFFAGYAAVFVFVPMVGIAVLIFAVEMLRASVLPIAPLTLLAAGGASGILAILAAGAITAAGGDAGHYGIPGLLVPLAFVAASIAWLGWHLWHETAADLPTPGPGALATT
jgi:hypothetical protein